jgi:hypothetical protein
MKNLLLAIVHAPMTRMIRNSLLSLLLVTAAAAYGGVPSMKVIVSDATGKVAFTGVTKADATFATGNLRPGKYVVQFNTKSGAVIGNQYLLVVSAGKKKVIADAVAGQKLTGSGVAMRVEVGPGLKITGQVAREDGVVSYGNAKVRSINGKRYVWVAAQTGSNLGAHWEDESVAPARNLATLSKYDFQKLQDRSFEGSMIGRYEHLERIGGSGF